MTPPVKDTSLPGLLEALERHERDVSATFARALGGRVVDRPDVLLYATGLPAEWANGAKAPRLDESSADEVVEVSRKMLDEVGVPGTWGLGPLATPPDLEERLERAGFERDFDLRMMAASIASIDLREEDPSGLQIRRVDSEAAHAAWLGVMTEGFAMPPEHTMTIDATARAVGFGEDAPWLQFVGTVDGEAVASSGLMLFGGLAGVYNVATVPTVRRRGYGAAMTRAALRLGRDRGYHVSVLGASDLGRGVYERMGYRDVGELRQYVYRTPGPDG